MTNTLPLRDPELFRQQAYLSGHWCDADSGATTAVNNPATGDVVGTVPTMGADETRRAMADAKKAWTHWRRRTAKERSLILRKWHDFVLPKLDDLGLLLTAEDGKELADAKRGDVQASGLRAG